MSTAKLPESIVIDDQWQGDTFPGLEFTITRNGVAKDITGADITFTFLRGNRRDIHTQVLTVGSGVTITDGPNAVMELDEITPFNWESGDYYGDCEIIYADSEIKTPAIFTWKIHQDKTNNS